MPALPFVLMDYVEDHMPAIRCSPVRPVRAALLAAAMFLAPAEQAMAQDTRAEIIRQETDVMLRSFASNRGRVSLAAGYLDAPVVNVSYLTRSANRRVAAERLAA